MAKSIERSFFSREVYKKLAALIEDEQPDVAIVQHYLRKLSPAVIKCLHDYRVPFVVRISDFGMVCPNGHLFRDGQICELCVSGALRNSVKHRCVQGSRAASAVNYAATRFHQAAGYYNLIHAFAVPSRFTLDKMADGGISRSRLVHLPTFVSAPEAVAGGNRPPTIVYAGRVEALKGVDVLLDAVRQLRARHPHDFAVRIIGFGDPEFTSRMREFATKHNLDNVIFEGALPEDGVREALRNARCSVAPSVWYENMPNSVLESMAEGTPAIGSGHGSIPELISDGETGLLVAPGESSALADAMHELLLDAPRAAVLGHRAHRFVSDKHSPERHYEILMSIFQDITRPDG